MCFRTILLKRVQIDSLQLRQNKRRISDTLCTFKLTSSQAWCCPHVGSSCGFSDSGSSIGNLRPIQMRRYVNFIILFVEYRLYDSSADRIVATRIARLIYNFVCKLTVPSISSFLDFRILETYVACGLRETLYHIQRNISFGYNWLSERWIECLSMCSKKISSLKNVLCISDIMYTIKII